MFTVQLKYWRFTTADGHAKLKRLYPEIQATQALQQTAGQLRHPLLHPIWGAEGLMPGAYSTDLRERVLVAVEAGEPADAVADEFLVGRSSVYRWMAAARDEGCRVA